MSFAPLHHVFIDFENVQEIDLGNCGDLAIKVTLLLGEKQKRLETRLVEQLLHRAAHVHLVRLESSGKNALDFTLAYYLGRAVVADPTTHFHLISRDKGFDPLIEHLQHQRLHVARHNAFADLPFLTPVPPPKPAGDVVSEVIAHLEAHPDNRPKRRRTLISHFTSGYLRLSEPEAEELITRLRQRRVISIDGKGAVAYLLDGSAPSPR